MNFIDDENLSFDERLGNMMDFLENNRQTDRLPASRHERVNFTEMNFIDDENLSFDERLGNMMDFLENNFKIERLPASRHERLNFTEPLQIDPEEDRRNLETQRIISEVEKVDPDYLEEGFSDDYMDSDVYSDSDDGVESSGDESNVDDESSDNELSGDDDESPEKQVVHQIPQPKVLPGPKEDFIRRFEAETNVKFDQVPTLLEEVCDLKTFCDDFDFEHIQTPMYANAFNTTTGFPEITVGATHSCCIGHCNTENRSKTIGYFLNVLHHIFMIDGIYHQKRRPKSLPASIFDSGHQIGKRFWGASIELMNWSNGTSNISPEFRSLNRGIKNVLETNFEGLISSNNSNGLCFITFINIFDKESVTTDEGIVLPALPSKFGFSLLIPKKNDKYQSISYLFNHQQKNPWEIAFDSLCELKDIELALRLSGKQYKLFSGIDPGQIEQLTDVDVVAKMLQNSMEVVSSFYLKIFKECKINASGGNCEHCGEPNLDFRYVLDGKKICVRDAKYFLTHGNKKEFRPRAVIDLDNLRIKNKSKNVCVLCHRNIADVSINNSRHFSHPTQQVLCLGCYARLINFDGQKVPAWNQGKTTDTNIKIVLDAVNDSTNPANQKLVDKFGEFKKATDDDLCQIELCNHTRSTCPPGRTMYYIQECNGVQTDGQICACCSSLLYGWNGDGLPAYIVTHVNKIFKKDLNKFWCKQHAICATNINLYNYYGLKAVGYDQRHGATDDDLCQIELCNHTRSTCTSGQAMHNIQECNGVQTDGQTCSCCYSNFSHVNERGLPEHIVTHVNKIFKKDLDDQWCMEHILCSTNINLYNDYGLKAVKHTNQIATDDDLCQIELCNHTRSTCPSGRTMNNIKECNGVQTDGQICSCCYNNFYHVNERGLPAYIVKYVKDEFDGEDLDDQWCMEHILCSTNINLYNDYGLKAVKYDRSTKSWKIEE